MKIIIKILKGILIGLGSILPGISGGMIAASFNIYKDLIEALSSFLKKPVKAILSIWEYLVGIVLGIGIGFILIATILKLFTLPVTCLFIGLILGGLPENFKEINKKNKKWYHYLIVLLTILLMLFLLFLKPGDITKINKPLIYLVYLLIGVLVALSLIVPGLSGTMILMALGFYTYLTETVSTFLKDILKFNIEGAISNLIPVFLLFIGGLLALIIFSKIISYILKKHKLAFNMAILGILLISPVNILYSLKLESKDIYSNLSALEIIASIVTFGIGLLVSYKMIGKEQGENYEV